MRQGRVGHAGQRNVPNWLGLAVGLVTCALLGFVPAAANAASAIGVSTSFPAIVAIGQSGVSAQIVVTNQNSAPDGSTTIAAAGTAITLTPACGMPDPLAVSGCSPAGADPNVFAVTGATGVTGSACAGQAFTVSSVDPAFGTVRVAPTTDLVLSAGASCTIGLTFSVSNLPVFDTDALAAGFQTAQHVTATAVSDMGGPASASSAGAGTTTVTLAAPTLTATVPATSAGSPADDNAPEVTGTAPAGGEQVFVYPTANCTGTPFTGAAAVFASPGITATVADNTTTTFSANADDSEDGFSACSNTLTYVERTTNFSPTPTGTIPASPSNNNAPRITGTAPVGSTTVLLYSNPGCTALIGQGSAADFVSPSTGVAVTVADNTTTTIYAKSQTGAVLSPCSTLWVTYVEDSTPPSALPPGGITPGSPANDNAPRITGAAPAGVIIRVYTNAACTGAVAATGTPAALQSPGLPLSVPDNSTTAFYTTATDDAGNESACSSPGIVYVEDSAPPETVIDSGPSGAGASSTPTFTFSSNEAGARFECRIDIAEFAACRSPFTAATLANGPHTFDVRAIDLVGHVDPTAAQRTFTVGGSVATPAPASKRLCAGISVLAYVGTAAADVRTGTSGTDHMSGHGGNDLLRGMAGRDCLYGGNGNDRLLSGSGNDRLFGEAGDDQLGGGVGHDNLQGGPGRDRLTDIRGLDRFAGGGGNDRIDARDTSRSDRRARDRIACGPGRDTVLVDRRDIVARDCERRITRR